MAPERSATASAVRAARRETRPRRSRRAAAAVAAIGAVVVATALIVRDAPPHRVAATLGRVSPLLLAAAVAAELVAFCGYAVAYRGVARVGGGPRLTLAQSAEIVLLGFGALVVASGIGTLGVDYWALRRAGAAREDAAARVVALNTLEWAVLGALAAVASALLLARVGGHVVIAVGLAWVAAVPLCFAAGTVVSSRGAVAHASQRVALPRRAAATIVTALVQLRVLVATRALGAVAATASYWLGELAALWLCLRAFGAHPSAPQLVVGFATGYAIMLLPLPVGGAGGVEAAVTYALTLVGVPLAPALVATLAYRACTFWLPALCAVGVVPFVPRLRARLGAVAAAGGDA